MSTSIRSNANPPPGSSAGKPSAVPPLQCNKCYKPLGTTCFLCTCDCIFCEECTYSHFEECSSCPSCGRTLREDDFTELVVADKSAVPSTDAERKQCLQKLLTKKSETLFLPFTDLCHSVMRQIDMSKMNTGFVLKQFLSATKIMSQRYAGLLHAFERLKQEFMQLKQTASSERLRFEQQISEQNTRIQSLEKTIQSKDEMIRQFQHMMQTGNTGGGQGVSSHERPSPPPQYQQPPQQHASSRQQQPEPPIRGFIKKKKANQRAQQEAYNQSQKHAPIMGHRSASSAPNPGSHGNGGGPMARQGARQGVSSAGNNYSSSRYQQPSVTPVQLQPPRPYSGNNSHPYSASNSIGSASSMGNPIRDLTSRAGYAFTTTRPQQQQHINKRRRVQNNGTPSSNGIASSHVAMSPSMAFTMNHGQQSQSYRQHGGASGHQHSFHQR